MEEVEKQTLTMKVKNFFLGSKKRKIVTLVLLVVIGFMVYRNTTKPDWEVEVITVGNDTLEETVSASGNVTAEKFAELTFLTNESIRQIVATEGAYLEQGDVIAYLDRATLTEEYYKAEAALRNAEAALAVVYDDVKGNDDDETLAQKEDRTSAETAKDIAYRNYAIAQRNLSKATLTAPFDGLVSYNSGTSIGKLSTTLSPSFSIVDPTTVYFEAEINEVDIVKVEIGTPVRLSLDAFDDSIDTHITAIGYVSVITSTGGTAYRVHIALPDNSDNKFRVGMNGDADIILSTSENTLTVPQSAVIQDSDANVVWIVDRGNLAQKKEVTIGVSSINDIEILDGLSQDEKVIVRPPTNIQEGDKIKIEEN